MGKVGRGAGKRRRWGNARKKSAEKRKAPFLFHLCVQNGKV